MEEVFRIYHAISTTHKDEEQAIGLLLSFLDGNETPKGISDLLLFDELKTNGAIDHIKVFQLIGLMHQKRRESEKIVNTDRRKHLGIYYTDYDIARLIVQNALKCTDTDALSTLKLYEPCAGTGIFIIAFIDEIFERLPIQSDTMKRVVDNVYFSDIDEDAIDILLKLLPIYLKSKYGIRVTIKDSNYFAGNALFTKNDQQISKVCPKEIFGVQDGFDIVLTNPPYKLLKANSNKYQNEDNDNKHALDIKELLSFIRKNNIYRLNQGTLNYYRIFLEEILENYTKADGKVGVIVPATLLSDKQSELLRKKILYCYGLTKLYVIPERNNFFPDISQAFCFFALDKKEESKVIEISPRVADSNDFSSRSIEVAVNQLEQIGSHAPIVIEGCMGWQIIKKMAKAPKLHSFTSIHNARGELDLTLDREFITMHKTPLPLLRGNNVDEFSYEFGNCFVSADFIKNRATAKRGHIFRERIVCQQVSNIHLEKRLKFAKIPSGIVLGNSCNFLALNKSLFNNGISLSYLLGILNSSLLNWRFKITNSNNHISNYELAELPIIAPTLQEKQQVENLVQLIEEGKHANMLHMLDAVVFKLYNLSEEEEDYVMSKYPKTIGKRRDRIPQNSKLFDYANI